MFALARDQLFDLAFEPRAFFQQPAGCGVRCCFVDAQRIEISRAREQSFAGFRFFTSDAVAVIVEQRVFGGEPSGAFVELFG